MDIVHSGLYSIVGLDGLCQHNFEHNGSQINVSIIEHNGSVLDTDTLSTPIIYNLR